MRYHYKKPEIYLSMYGKVYFCDHPVYHCCTLFQIGEKGLAVIQQRFDLIAVYVKVEMMVLGVEIVPLMIANIHMISRGSLEKQIMS